jgi:transcription elongation GreA/GreB family factor
MSDLADIQQRIDEGDFDSIEDIWLERLAIQPADHEFFIAVAQALVAAEEEDRAAFLVDLLADHIQEAGDGATRLEILRHLDWLYPDATQLHAAILETVRDLYRDSPSLEGVIEKVGLLKAKEDIPKTWTKVDKLRQILQFEVGEPVWMEGKGAGRVIEVNLDLDNFKVDLEHQPGLRVGFRAAAKLLQPLPPGHFLRRKLESPEELVRLKDENPGELLLALLSSYPEPRAAGDIRRVLTGIVGDGEWTSWWSAARKHPQILTVGSGSRQSYTWAASDSDAIESMQRAFSAADPVTKIELLRKNAGRSAELKAAMVSELQDLVEERVARDPSTALAIALALDKAGAPPTGDCSPAAIIEAHPSPADLISGLGDRILREQALPVIRSSRSDWGEIFRALLGNEEDTRLLSALAHSMRSEENEHLQAFIDDLISKPRPMPAAFLWLAENAESESLFGDRNSLRLIQLIISALHWPEFKPYRARLTKLFETGGSLPHLLSQLSPDQALQAETAIERAALEDYLREPLINALHLRFPDLRPDQEAPLYATPQSIESRRQELQRLLDEEIPANRRAIEEARAMGDLRENFEYKSARQRHEYLSARVEALKGDLGRVRTFDPSAIDTTEVRIGSTLVLESTAGESRSLTILGPWESSPEEGIISYDSELGQALLGSKVGDKVPLDGQQYELKQVGTWS